MRAMPSPTSTTRPTSETSSSAAQTAKSANEKHLPMSKSELGGIIVLDFGGQYTQLIARRIREQQVFSAILPCTASLTDIRAYEPAGIILSGSTQLDESLVTGETVRRVAMAGAEIYAGSRNYSGAITMKVTPSTATCET